MSTNIVGFVEADDKWNKMKDVWDICKLADIDPPNEVLEFFDYVYPGDAPGMEVKLGFPAVVEWSDSYREGYEVNLELLPENVKFIRFYNSY
jgi:hypothetical protein